MGVQSRSRDYIAGAALLLIWLCLAAVMPPSTAQNCAPSFYRLLSLPTVVGGFALLSPHTIPVSVYAVNDTGKDDHPSVAFIFGCWHVFWAAYSPILPFRIGLP